MSMGHRCTVPTAQTVQLLPAPEQTNSSEITRFKVASSLFCACADPSLHPGSLVRLIETLPSMWRSAFTFTTQP